MNEESVTNDNVTKERSSAPKSSFLGVSLALLLAAGAFFSGMQVSQVTAEAQSASLFSFFNNFNKTTAASEEADLTEFWHVWKLLDEKYISASSTEIITKEDRINGAISGMVSSFGDPYTAFFPPVENAAFSEDISGNFSGVGMEIGIRDDIITVIAPLPQTPAEKAGLLSGDKIIRINDISTDKMGVDEAVRLIRGEKGTEVVMSIYREGDLEFREVKIVRDTIDIPTIATEKIDDVFIIRLFSFNALSDSKMQEGLEEFQKSGANKLILDLRGNPGGYLQSAVSIAGFFLPSGKVVVRESFSESEKEKLFRSPGRMIKEFTPQNLVVLVDGGSASASEILAGALGEHEVATIIGVNTFGKGSVQELVQLPNDSSVKITIARWLTPNGTSISNGGLAPNYTISRTPENRINNIDPQQEAAIKFLAGKTIVSE